MFKSRLIQPSSLVFVSLLGLTGTASAHPDHVLTSLHTHSTIEMLGFIIPAALIATALLLIRKNARKSADNSVQNKVMVKKKQR